MPAKLDFDDGFSEKQPSERLLERLFPHRWLLTSLATGILLLISGSFLLSSNPFEETKVEVLGSSSSSGLSSSGELISEISGSVQNPGVYKLSSDGRVDDLLVKAGGLSLEADRDWVEKNLNRAQKLIDGQKIYIPKTGESPAQNVGGNLGSTLPSAENKININSASLKELDSLSGIGTVRAQAIIDNRPYATIEQLTEKKVLSKSVFEKIKESIVAY